MKNVRLIKIVGFIILPIIIILWQLGFFYRFNYFTAKIDIIRKTPRLVITEIPLYDSEIDPIPYIGLNEKYGFHEHYTGCNVTKPQIRGIESYNTQIEKYLIVRNGNNWKAKYQAEIDTLVKDFQKRRIN